MKVLLVDDSALFLEGLESLLSARAIEVIGTANDGLEALERARTLRPDVILMDIDMPRGNGLTATRLIKAEMPEIDIVMLTVSDENADLFEAIKSGAAGYLLKDLNAQELFTQLERLARGEPPFSPGLAAKILAAFARQSRASATSPEAEALTVLTARQRGVLALITEGLTYQEIGDALHISERTVKYHLQQIMERLHLQNRAQVIAFAARAGSRLPKS
ncbi:MAG: response regulator [Anaerolineales bacterium]